VIREAPAWQASFATVTVRRQLVAWTIAFVTEPTQNLVAPDHPAVTCMMRHTISPLLAARELRSRAASASGAEQAYLLWLASEWDKVAEREAASRPGSGPRKAARS